jgi:hypothetical protein
MALTKVTKSGITDNSIDADKIEDGTIVAADIADGTITAAKLASTLDISTKTVTLPNTSVTSAMLAGSIANAKLANSTITVNGTSVSLGGSVSAGSIEWQAVKTADFNAVAGEGYFVDTDSVGAVTATLPGSPSAGDTIAFKDYAANFGTNALTIARNGNNIQGVANDSEISTNRASIVLVYIDATKGWLYTNESNVADFGPTYITATGGTVTTSGDFKIHTFTGDGCFVVSSLGTNIPCAQASIVDYLVVAGGGGGSPSISGGGGAGGFREGKDSTLASPHTASPLAATSGLTISATTYPIVVGGGGTLGSSGSNSVFSTITSTAGGKGGAPNATGSPGGSGGGGGGNPSGDCRAGGSGNTPPTSPSQGNNGGVGAGNGPAGWVGGGGGGGASNTGTPHNPPNGGGSGGPGAGTGINTSCTVGTPGPNGALRYFAGGGAGLGPGPNGSPGTGGGGSGGGNGTANTGGGAGGQGAGGKGIIIIRYKFQ